MGNFLIPRRFVRIKALQNLYAYTIRQIAHKKEATEQVKKDFIFNSFLDEPDQKDQRAKEQKVAVALFSEAVAAALPTQDVAYRGNNPIEQSVYRHLGYYVAALKQDQTLLQNGFNQSKESIYIALLYILHLLVKWYKLAKETDDPSQSGVHLLNNQLAQNPLLKELYHNSNWMNAIYKTDLSWHKDPDQVETWYRQFIQPTEIPKAYRANPSNSVKILEYILQNIIFETGPINDFLAMADLYWDEHKHIVKKILSRIFIMLSAQDFNAFTLFWHNLEQKWAIAGAFYNRILTIVIQNSSLYETMIGDKTEKWDRERITLTDKLILKLALAELLTCKEIPFKVSINEYIEIAKWYGTAKSGSFVNGVLEGILNGLHHK